MLSKQGIELGSGARKWLLSITLLVSSIGLNGQITVNSSNGYQVHIDIMTTTVNAPGSCAWGYNYTVNLDYTVTFSGSNIPANLYTLQGNLTCSTPSNFFNLPNSGGTGTAITANSWTSQTDCSTSTPSSLGCTSGTIQIGGPGIPTQTIPFSAITLPVELTYFKSTNQDDGLQLIWETATEKDNDYFTIQKSLDGMSFQDLEIIEGAGNSNTPTTYKFTDFYFDSDAYYRLVQTDFDGTQTIEGVLFEAKPTVDEIPFSAYPNPNASNRLQLMIAAGEHGSLKVFSSGGALVFEQYLQNERVVYPELEPGYYIIEWRGNHSDKAQHISYIQQ